MWFRRRISTAQLGRLGEWRAAWFYRLRGYTIVARNFRFRRGEIDLVVRRGRTLVVAEIKTRRSRAAGEGYEAVGAEKRRRLVALADQYLARTELRDVQLRYDIVSLFWNGWWFALTHYADAFRPVAEAGRPWKWTA